MLDKFPYYPIRDETMKAIAKGLVSKIERHSSSPLTLIVNESKHFSLLELTLFNDRYDLHLIPIGDMEGQSLNRANYPELYKVFDVYSKEYDEHNEAYCSCNNQVKVTNQAYGKSFKVCSKSRGGCGKEIL